MRGPYIDTPGPMQMRVLESLAVFLAAGREWVTTEEIAEASGMSVGSVKGCTSGMQKQNRRLWVKQRWITRPEWKLLPNGMAALLKEKRITR